jgi:hypothetical protein
MAEPSGLTIAGVPRSITHERYMEVIRSLGFDPFELKELHLDREGIYATVRAKDSRGQNIPDGPLGFAEHRVFIRIEH